MGMEDPLRCRCWAFIDGVFRYCARPQRHQRALYNAHYAGHGFKYQAITSPCGIIEHVYGPVSGRRHDAFILDVSEVFTELPTFATYPQHPAPYDKFYIYGDPAYPQRSYVRCPFKGVVTPDEHKCNSRMSSVRVTVEWGFKEVSSRFAALDFVRQEKIRQGPVALKYLVAVFLTNCLTCLDRDNQISQYFNVQPPTLDEYLNDM